MPVLSHACLVSILVSELCAVFFYRMEALCSKVYGAGLKSIVDALFWYVVDARALRAVMLFSLSLQSVWLCFFLSNLRVVSTAHFSSCP